MKSTNEICSEIHNEIGNEIQMTKGHLLQRIAPYFSISAYKTREGQDDVQHITCTSTMYLV